MDIKIRNLYKSYGDKRVLADFSATLREKRTACLMGPSGCGKTTLLGILMGLIKYDAGLVEGVPPRKSAVFQEDRLCEDFTAAENIRLVTGKRVTDAAIVEQLALLGLGESLSAPVREYSGGMKRRVAIARAMLAGGDIYFLDEPFKGLDAENRRKAAEYIKSHTAGKTLVAVTHDEAEAALLGGEIIKMGGAV
jgi:NitT/TauT family transport system ATP-binding protein